jgi:hypothetical protein
MADLPLQVFDSGMDDRLLAIEKLDPTCRPPFVLPFFSYSLLESQFFLLFPHPSVSERQEKELRDRTVTQSPGKAAGSHIITDSCALQKMDCLCYFD